MVALYVEFISTKSNHHHPPKIINCRLPLLVNMTSHNHRWKGRIPKFLSDVKLPKVASWSSTRLRSFLEEKHHISNIDLVIYWLRQEILHIKIKIWRAQNLSKRRRQARNLIRKDDVQLATFVAHNMQEKAVDFYVSEYAVWRFEEGIAPPPKGLPLPFFKHFRKHWTTGTGTCEIFPPDANIPASDVVLEPIDDIKGCDEDDGAVSEQGKEIVVGWFRP